MRLLIMVGLLLAGILPVQAESPAQGNLPRHWHQIILQTVPGELAVGTPVVFEATTEMGLGQVGTTYGTIYGYSFQSHVNVIPPSWGGTFNRADYPVVEYIVWIERHAGNNRPWAYTAMLERGEFQLR